MSHSITVRFAPSPTGYLHVGGARTALFNFLFAKRAGGRIYLRIEDTDAVRDVRDAVDRLKTDFEWLGISFTPWLSGNYGESLFRQSERHGIYFAVARELVNIGIAYPCWCSPDRLEALRKSSVAQKLPPRYDKNCLRLSESVKHKYLSENLPQVIRLKSNPQNQIVINDLLKGDVTFSSTHLDDPILVRSDGSATSILAGVVDDHDMGVTHILRGEEWLPSTPYQKSIFEALGWQLPQWGHLSLLLGEDRRKLSKRNGGSTIKEIRDMGFFPQALCRYLTSLGRSNIPPETGWSMQSLADDFDLGLYRSGEVIYSLSALTNENQRFIQQSSPDVLWSIIEKDALHQLPVLHNYSPENLIRLVRLTSEAAVTFHEIIDQMKAIVSPVTASLEIWSEFPDSGNVLSELLDQIEKVTDEWSIETVKSLFNATAKATSVKGKMLYTPVRLALTQTLHGPSIIEIALLLGPAECHKRIESSLKNFHEN